MSEQPSTPVASLIGKYANIVAGIIIMAIAATAIVVSLNFPTTPIPTDIGAGAFPRLFASILIVLCALLIVSELIRKPVPVKPAQALRKDPATDGEYVAATQEEKSYVTPAIGALAMIAYIGLMSWVGYVPLTFLFLVGLIRLMGFSSILFNLLISAAITASLYFLFDVGLQVPLPVGELFG